MEDPNDLDSGTFPYMIRMDKARLAKFQRIMPDRGDVPSFINAAMDEFIRLWGDRPTPHEVAAEAARNVSQNSDKARHTERETPPSEPEGKIIDLMAALKESLKASAPPEERSPTRCTWPVCTCDGHGVDPCPHLAAPAVPDAPSDLTPEQQRIEADFTVTPEARQLAEENWAKVDAVINAAPSEEARRPDLLLRFVEENGMQKGHLGKTADAIAELLAHVATLERALAGAREEAHQAQGVGIALEQRLLEATAALAEQRAETERVRAAGIALLAEAQGNDWTNDLSAASTESLNG